MCPLLLATKSWHRHKFLTQDGSKKAYSVTQLAGHRRKTEGMFHYMAQIENDNGTHLIASCRRLRRNRSLANVIYFFLAFLKLTQKPKKARS